MLSLGESAMRDSARFHFGFTSFRTSRISVRQAAVDAVAKSKGDLALVSATSQAGLRGGSHSNPMVRTEDHRSPCRSSSVPTIRLHYPCLWFRASRITPW